MGRSTLLPLPKAMIRGTVVSFSWRDTAVDIESIATLLLTSSLACLLVFSCIVIFGAGCCSALACSDIRARALPGEDRDFTHAAH